MTYDLDLDILPLGVHAKIQVCMSVHSAVRVRRKDGQTHTQTMPKLLHPTRLRDVGCNNDVLCNISRVIWGRFVTFGSFHFSFFLPDRPTGGKPLVKNLPSQELTDCCLRSLLDQIEFSILYKGKLR